MLLTSCMIFTCKESRRSNNFIWASLTNEYSSPNNKRNKNEEDGCSVDVVCVRDRLLTFEIAMNGNSSTVKTIVAFLMKHHQRKSKVNLFISYLKAFPWTWKSRVTKRLVRGIEIFPFASGWEEIRYQLKLFLHTMRVLFGLV